MDYLLAEAYNEVHQDKIDLFIDKRSVGAKKIEKSAEAKGGYSKLTYFHFKAKGPCYKQAASHIGDQKFLEDKINECLSKLKSWKTMSQHDFQVVMGQLEVWGEVFIDVEHPKTY